MSEIHVPSNIKNAQVEVQKIGRDGTPAGPPERICFHRSVIDKVRCRAGRCPLGAK